MNLRGWPVLMSDGRTRRPRGLAPALLAEAGTDTLVFLKIGFVSFQFHEPPGPQIRNLRQGWD